MKSNSSFNLSKTSKKMLATTPKKIRSIFKDRQPKPVKETPSDQTNN